MNTQKLVRAFKATPDKDIRYKPYLSGIGGFVCNGFVGAQIRDADLWKKLMLSLEKEAEKDRIKTVVYEDLDTMLDKVIRSADSAAVFTGVSVHTSTGVDTQLFRSGTTPVVVNSIYADPFDDYEGAGASASTAPLVLSGLTYTAIICPMHPKTVIGGLLDTAALFR